MNLAAWVLVESSIGVLCVGYCVGGCDCDNKTCGMRYTYIWGRDGVLALYSEGLTPSKDNWWHSGFWTVWDSRSFRRGLDKRKAQGL